MSPEKSMLDDVVRDAKELLGPDLVGRPIDWAKVDAGLMARVESEARARAALGRFRGTRAWGAVAAALALAAAVPFVVGPSSTTPVEDAVARESRADRSAGAFAWKEGAGDVRVGAMQVVASAGSALVRGDAVEAHGARGVFERRAHAEPGAVTWAIEDASRAVVTGTRGALILALERGAIEAQVTPVANGEAFAVDVDGARVAVHGTHLRVAREGTHVTVDLTEGVVSIGAPARVGSTYGALVTAPAHVEFDASDPKGTLKVTHAPERVRAAIALRPPHDAPIAAAPRGEPEATHAPSAARATGGGALAHASGIVKSPPASPSDEAAPTPSAPAAPAIDLHPEATIANAVRACAASSEGATSDDEVVVTISSVLELRVGPLGTVESARFEPPLPPEVQSCASTAIYKARFNTVGPISIPLKIRR